MIKNVHCCSNSWYQLRYFLLWGDFAVSDGFIDLCDKVINVVPKELLRVGLTGEPKLTVVMDVLETFTEVLYHLS